MPFTFPNKQEILNTELSSHRGLQRRRVTLKWGALFVEDATRGKWECFPLRTMLHNKLGELSIRLITTQRTWVRIDFNSAAKKEEWMQELAKCNYWSLNEFYKDTVKIGEGGNGNVYKMTRLSTGAKVAVKILKYNSIASVPELTFSGSLNHENLLIAEDILLASDITAIVTPLMNGGDLLNLIRRFPGGVPEHYAKRLFKSILTGVAYLHRNRIAHRDLKPENVFVKFSGPVTEIKIGDFGAAKLVPQSGAFPAPERQGTTLYMSPEQAKGMPYGLKADVFACGHILYNLLTARLAFGGQNLMQQIRNVELQVLPTFNDLSHDARNLLESLMWPNPNHRIPVEHALQHKWITGTN